MSIATVSSVSRTKYDKLARIQESRDVAFGGSAIFQAILDDVWRPNDEPAVEDDFKEAEKSTESHEKVVNVAVTKEDKPKHLDRKERAKRQAAHRGWNIIKEAVEELKQENKAQKNTGFGWNFLRHTLNNMTDMEKAREELYERYLYKPLNWGEGIANFKERLDVAIKNRKIALMEQSRDPPLDRNQYNKILIGDKNNKSRQQNNRHTSKENGRVPKSRATKS